MSGNIQDHDSSDRSSLVQDVVKDCLRRRAAGEAVSDESLIAAHSELMPELGEELKKLQLIGMARQQADQADTDQWDAQTTDHILSAKLATDSGSGRLEVRCPNCHTPMEVAVDTMLTDLTCESCGSHFSLVDQSQATRMAPSLSKLGRFELVERIGVGGFGSVWKARDKQLDRTVAVKVPRRGDMTAEEQEKFLREARAAAQLSHPNIVRVYEVGRDEDSLYIVSDFVRGVTLGDWLSDQQLTNREAAELTVKIAEALHHAHEQGVIHRDLKPANVMIDGQGEPHLMDFGLARREMGEVTMTIDGQVLGTPAYMSPEQALGESHTADRRSDIYSLGVILFQLLTGDLPFRGNARMIMHKVIHNEAPSPRTLNPNVHRDLETITLKCLEKEPGKRYRSSEDVVQELQRYLNGEPIGARPISRSERAVRWVKRHRVVSALSSIAFLAMLLGTWFSVYFAIDASFQAEVAVEQRTQAVDAKNQAEEAQRTSEAALEKEQLARKEVVLTNKELRRLTADQQRLIYNHDSNRVAMEYFVHSFEDVALEHVRTELNRDPPTAGKGFEFRFLVDQLTPHCTRYDLNSWVSAIRMARSSTFFVVGLESGNVLIYRQGSDDPMATSDKHDGPVTRIALDEKGNFLVSAGLDNRIFVWDLRTGNKIHELKGTTTAPRSLGCALDDELIACLTKSGEILVWNTNDGKLISKDRLDYEFEQSVVSPDGSTIAIGSKSDGVLVWNIKGRKILHTFDQDILEKTSPAAKLTYSLDGKELIARYQYAGMIFSWNIESGKEVYRRVGGSANDPFPGDSFPGDMIALTENSYVGFDWSVAEVWNYRSRLRDKKFMVVPFWDLQYFQPWGCLDISRKKIIAAARNRIYVHDLERLLRPSVIYPENNDSCVDMEWLPNKEILLVATSKGNMHIINPKDGTSNSFSVRSDDEINAISVSCDGQTVAIQDNQGKIHIINWESHLKIAELDTKVSGWKPMTFSPVDPNLLATVDMNGLIRLWNTRKETKLREIRTPLWQARRIAFRPDGKVVVALGIEGSAQIWDLNTDFVSEPVTVDAVGAVAFSKLTDAVVFGGWSGRVHVCDREFQVTKRLLGARLHVWSADFCDSGERVLASGSHNDEVHMWDVTTGNLVATYELQDCAIVDLELSTDETCLALLDHKHNCIRLLHAPRYDEQEIQNHFNTSDPFSSKQVPPLVADWQISYYQLIERNERYQPADWDSTIANQPLFVQRADALNFEWGTESPASSVPKDMFATVASTTVSVGPGHYEISTYSDDAIRVYINNRLVLESWYPHAAKLDSARVMLEGDSQHIRVEHYDGAYDATLKFALMRKDLDEARNELEIVIPSSTR